MFIPDDVRNKLTPLKNLITIMEEFLQETDIQKKQYLENSIQKQIPSCKVSLDYLSGNGTQELQ